ncbi:hypothetical protein NARC_150110 [Candidatus Nitrosocosmicus arcticus]|uniref:Uncharacterized protein n=2 Tax=Candidatus Nitrosocosmicus arcticus TaxID=2035267 RepID=A0A557SSD4_9ARCH|nr:hypothetical protein NARC_150110 [Candidatus Nitrosocosmicus arcticus]
MIIFLSTNQSKHKVIIIVYSKKKSMTTDKKGNESTNNIKKINKKGIILTSILVISIIGASFIVWFLPSENIQNSGMSNMTISFLDPNDTLTSVNSQFLLLQNEVQDQINYAKANSVNETYISDVINVSIIQNNELMQTLLNGQPNQSLMPNYVELMNNLRDYSLYLQNVKNITSNSLNMSQDLKNLGNNSGLHQLSVL